MKSAKFYQNICKAVSSLLVAATCLPQAACFFENPPPVEQQGTIAVFWSFLYPTDDRAISNCATAGVSTVDLHVFPADGVGDEFFQTFSCDSNTIEVQNLATGRYVVEMTAYGDFQNQDLPLYSVSNFVVDVFPNQITELGEVALPRIEESFGDVEIIWNLGRETCASAGVRAVNFTIQRNNLDVPDDEFDIDCSTPVVDRRVFVPGFYVVTAFADGVQNGSARRFVGGRAVGVEPNAISSINLDLQPQ